MRIDELIVGKDSLTLVTEGHGLPGSSELDLAVVWSLLSEKIKAVLIYIQAEYCALSESLLRTNHTRRARESRSKKRLTTRPGFLAPRRWIQNTRKSKPPAAVHEKAPIHYVVFPAHPAAHRFEVR